MAVSGQMLSRACFVGLTHGAEYAQWPCSDGVLQPCQAAVMAQAERAGQRPQDDHHGVLVRLLWTEAATV